MRLLKYYKDTICSSLLLYWKVYGGWRALLKSPYLHFSIILSFSLYPLWLSLSEDTKRLWYDLILSIVPNILGFTLGGYAIFLAFGDKSFLKIIAKYKNNKKLNSIVDQEITPFLKVNGAFIHFIVIQCISLIFALYGYAWQITNPMFSFIGVILLIYSLFTALAAALALLNLSNWYSAFLNKEDKG